MATTLTIPGTTLTAGSHTFGPVSIATGLTRLQITLDVGSYPSNQTVTFTLQRSDDGGTTWGPLASGTANGGTQNNDGVLGTDWHISTNIGGDPNNSLRRARALVVPTASFTTSGGTLVAS